MRSMSKKKTFEQKLSDNKNLVWDVNENERELNKFLDPFPPWEALKFCVHGGGKLGDQNCWKIRIGIQIG